MMTLTDTVTSVAHDAARTASDLGKHAVVLGRSAAEAAADAATSAAATAHQLVETVSSKVPTVSVKVKPARNKPWRLIIGLTIAGVVAAVYWKSRKSSSTSTYRPLDETNESSGPSAVRMTA